MRRTLDLCALVLILGAPKLIAATLLGRVVDPSSAVVPDATVRLTNGVTHQTFATQSDSHGDYRFSSVRSGIYTLSAEAPGFETSTREGLQLRDGEPTEVDLGLRLRAMAEKVTVTASAPNFETALDGREVKESAARDVGEALTGVEGLWKVRKGGIANAIVLRGFQSGNINVLVDGARIFGACPSHMDPPEFHVDFAEVQEVVVTKGAFDVKNEGSLGGSIQIMNKDEPAGRGFHVLPSFSAGSFGFVNPSLTASYSNGKSDMLAGYSYRRSNPYTDGAGRPFTDYANFREGMQSASAFDVQTGWGKFAYSPKETHRLEFGYARQSGDHILYPYLMMDAPYDHADRLKAAYDINNGAGALRHLHLEAYDTQVHHWMTDEFRTSSLGTPRNYNMATLAATQALGFRAEAELPSLSLGTEVYRRNWDATNTMLMMGNYMGQNFIPDVRLWLGGAFGEYRRTFARKLHVDAGGRVDSGSSVAQSASLNTDLYWAYNGTRLRSNSDTNPAGNVQLAYDFGKGLSVFSGVGSTVRLPDPAERYFSLSRMGSDWVGNPLLRPTRNTEIDWGVNYAGRRLRVRPTLFYSQLEDFIVLHQQETIHPMMSVMNTVARSYENVNARLYGGELTYSVGITRSLLLLGGASYTVGKNTPRPEYTILSTNLAEIPPLKAQAELRYGTRRFFGELCGLAVDAQNRLDADLGEQRTPGYFTMGGKAGVHTKKLNFAAGIDNLLDRFYYEYLSFQRDPFRSGMKIPEPGRNVYVSVSYGF